MFRAEHSFIVSLLSFTYWMIIRRFLEQSALTVISKHSLHGNSNKYIADASSCCLFIHGKSWPATLQKLIKKSYSYLVKYGRIQGKTVPGKDLFLIFLFQAKVNQCDFKCKQHSVVKKYEWLDSITVLCFMGKSVIFILLSVIVI